MVDSTSTLTNVALRYLASIELPSTLNRELLNGLLQRLLSPETLDASRVTLTFDLIAKEEDTWTIAASTDSTLVSDRQFTVDQGLTGWALRTNRSRPLHLKKANSFPSGLNLLEPIQGIQSAFVYILRPRNKAIAALCAISQEEGRISDFLAGELLKVGRILEIVFGEPYQSPQGRRYGDLSSPPSIVADKAMIVQWLHNAIDGAGFEWADYWEWNAEDAVLDPIPVSRQLRSQNLDWLRPLKLQEGFVGQAAYTRTAINEPRIRDGKGLETGIQTPLAEIQPGVPLCSILAIPVFDAHQLHGVISVLGETEDQFDKRAEDYVTEIATKAASPLKEIAERKLVTAHTILKKELFDALENIDTPSRYWIRLSKVLNAIETHRLGISAYFWIAKRHDPEIFTCKAASPTARDSIGRVYDSRNERLFAYLKSHRNRAIPVSKIKSLNLDVHQRLESLNVSKIWLDRFPKTDGDPLFLAAVTLPDRTHYTPGLGTRSLDQLLDPIFAAIFATTRAVLNAEDASSRAKERERIMKTGAHELRSPLSSVRNKLEAMTLTDNDSKAYRTELLEDIDLLLLGIANMLYAYKKNASSKEPLSLLAVCEEAIELFQTAESEATITLDSSSLAGGAATRIHGVREWLLVALRNVIHNAVKFGRNGPVLISLRLISEGEPQPWIEVEIKDHGIGIPAGELSKIFQPGHKNPHSRAFVVQGSQIGLATTKEIIEEHGGRIWASSSIEKSRTSFYIRIPATPASKEEDYDV